MVLSLSATDIFSYSPIKGIVKEYTQTDFTVASKFGSYYRTPSNKVTHVLDVNGKELVSTELSPRDVILNKIVNTYDTSGNLTDQICEDSDGTLVWKSLITYKDGLKDSSSEYDAKGNLKSKSIYTYENNLLVDESGYTGDGDLVWKTIYKYDSENRIQTVCDYSGDGILSSKQTFTYTDNGKIDVITTFDSFSDNSTQNVFRYTDGLLTEITTYGKDKEVIKRIIYKYDGRGNPIKVSEYNIANKFGTTVNELIFMSEVVYKY